MKKDEKFPNEKGELKTRNRLTLHGNFAIVKLTRLYPERMDKEPVNAKRIKDEAFGRGTGSAAGKRAVSIQNNAGRR